MDRNLRELERRALVGDFEDKAVLERARRRAGSPCVLYDLVSENLLELAWRANYALSPVVGLGAFAGAFQRFGFRVENTDGAVVISVRRSVGGVERSLVAKLGYDTVLRGWNHHPRGSPRSLYDSICEVYDCMGRSVAKTAERYEWAKVRDVESRAVRRSMDDFLLSSISDLQEHAFLSALGDVSSGSLPRVFYVAKGRFPMDLYERSKKFNAVCGPDACCILERDVSEFNNSYHPSVSAMEELFWGLYLDAFANEKGYPVLDEDPRLRSLISRGWDGLAPGRDIWPPRRQ